MTWASQRRLIVWGVIGGVLAALAALFYFAFLYRAPTCTDGIKNGSETAVDRGGTCPYLDNAYMEPPTVLFTAPLLNGEGRTDVIALVENKNQDAGTKNVPYTIVVYGYDQQLIQRVTGTLDLPPGATVPVFVPGLASGRAAPATAFLTIESEEINWYVLAEDPRILPAVSNAAITGATSTPRITATLSNPDIRAMKNVKAVVVVRNGQGNAIAASQTILTSIPAQGRATATFTWNAPFDGDPVSITVLPIIALP